MDQTAKDVAQDVAIFAAAGAIAIALGYVVKKRQMKRLNKEYKELCETVKI